MRKTILAIIALTMSLMARAGEGDSFLTTGAGFLFNSTLDATLGMERELAYDDAVELFGEAGNHWQRDGACGRICKESFWRGYYWDGGILYKKSLKRLKNSRLKLRIGPVAGAVKGRFFMGVEGGIEYNYIFQSGLQLSLIQKNNVCFLHGDTFRNGLLLSLKIPF